MPAAALPFIGAGLSAGGSIGSGKKGKHAQDQANKIAQQQLGLQQQQFGLEKQQVGYGNQALAPSTGYWNDLLKGGQAAVQATGPYASLIGQNAAGARNAITSLTPRGGEQNLALAQNYNQTSNDISRLYAGMQPLAAQNLAQNAGVYMGSGGQFNPNPNIGAAASLTGLQQQIANQGSGLGGALYGIISGKRGGGGGGGTPPFVGGKQGSTAPLWGGS